MAETMRLWNRCAKCREWMIDRLWVHLQKGRLDADGLEPGVPLREALVHSSRSSQCATKPRRFRLEETTARLLRPLWPVKGLNVLETPEMTVLELPDQTRAHDGLLPLVNKLTHYYLAHGYAADPPRWRRALRGEIESAESD